MKKYKVTQEFMDSLDDWRGKFMNGEIPVNALTHETHNNVVELWRFEKFGTDEFIQRLGALLNWINGEDVLFEIGTPSYIVQRKVYNLFIGRQYISRGNYGEIIITSSKEDATRFDDFNKASEFANAHFEVVEVDE
jgi:hypothetical protein